MSTKLTRNLIVGGLALFTLSACSTVQSVADGVGSVASSAVDAAGSVASGAVDAAGSVASGAADAVGSAVDTVTSAGSSATTAVAAAAAGKCNPVNDSSKVSVSSGDGDLLHAGTADCPADAVAEAAPSAPVSINLDSSVLFATGSSQLSPTAADELDAAIAQLGGATAVTVTGHTDSVGSEESNQVLSAARADIVASYLTAYGVSADITTEAKGESEPIADNATAEGRQQNRRVTITGS